MLGWRGWRGEAAATESWGTIIAALPSDGHARDGRGRVVVVPDTLVVVVAPGRVVVEVDEVVVVETEVDVVPELAVAGNAPTMRATMTAPTPRSEMMTRHNFEASE